MTKHAQIALAAVAVVLLGIGYVFFTRQQRVETKSQDLAFCTTAPEQTAIGSVTYPVAPQYKNVRGLGMIFTAADCGEERLATLEKSFQYGLVGGKLFLRTLPTPAARDALVSLGFSCVDGETECKQWSLGNTVPSSQNLLKLKPFVDQIEREECGQCG